MRALDRRVWQDIDGDDRAFRWFIPQRFNIGTACADLQPPADLAMIVDDHDGDGVHRWTFGELARRSNQFVTVLRSLGIGHGDRVGVMAPQGLDVATAHLGAYKAGAIVVPMSTQFGPDAMVYRLDHATARALVISGEGLERLAGAWDKLQGLEHVLGVDPTGAAGAPAPEHPRLLDLGDELEGAEPATDPEDTAADDPALLLYTSGTTGPPKGVLHRHQTLLAQMPGLRLSHDGFPQPGDVFWTPADWAWAGGLFDAVLPSLLCGRPIVASRGKFEPARAYRLMARHRVRNCFLPPTALKQLRQAGPPPPGVDLRTIASGGEPLGESILTWVRQHLGVVVNEFYGQTEANLLVGNGAGRGAVRAGSMGRPYPGSELTLLDEHDDPVSLDEHGEVALRLPHPGAFAEYWRDPERTTEKVRDGWLRTGDQASQDAGGYLTFAGRADDIISSGGYRIGPGEIEDCLISHPDVVMAAVIGVPDDVRGEAVAAYVVPAIGVEPDATLTTALQDHVKHRLAFYQYPRRITYVRELPMTTTGKIQRAELRRAAARELAGEPSR